jgi:HAD superfamily hydrolase (TIGR01509 family)
MRGTSSRLRAYLFDFNGVLVDDEAVHFAAFRDVVGAHGVVLDEATYLARYFAFDDQTAFAQMFADAGRARDEALIRRCIEDKSRLYFRAIDGALKIFPGAFELLAACASRGQVAIVSGAARREIEHALALTNSASDVTTIVAAEDVAACKPDPAGYLAALARLGVEARDAIVVEDSVGGVTAARAAGCRVVAVAHSDRADRLKNAGANVVVDAIGALTLDALDAALDAAREGA